MATKKVKGYMLNRGGWIEFHQSPDPAELWVPCTMVLPEKADERVYTASEVLPDIEGLLKWVHRETAFLRECGKPQPEAERMVGFMATRYGIKLDPA